MKLSEFNTVVWMTDTRILAIRIRWLRYLLLWRPDREPKL